MIATRLWTVDGSLVFSATYPTTSMASTTGGFPQAQVRHFRCQTSNKIVAGKELIPPARPAFAAQSTGDATSPTFNFKRGEPFAHRNSRHNYRVR
jgi:hypothetical protein